MKRWLPLVLLGLTFLSWTNVARACGASAASGGVAVCTVEEIREKERKKWRVGSAWSWSSTDLLFSRDDWAENERFSQERHAAIALLEWRKTKRLSFQFGAGGLLGGSLGHPTLLGAEQRTDLNPGFVGALGLSYLAVVPKDAVPFVLFTSQLSAVVASAGQDEARATYHAYDLRLGTSVGWTVWKSLSPYAVGRVFGGPVYWKIDDTPVRGSDRYHVQLGAGLSWLIKYRFDVYVEGIALGEQGLSAGVGWAF